MKLCQFLHYRLLFSITFSLVLTAYLRQIKPITIHKFVGRYILRLVEEQPLGVFELA